MSKGNLSYLYWLDRTIFGSCPKINFLQDLNLTLFISLQNGITDHYPKRNYEHYG